MDAADTSRESAHLHVSTLLVAPERALNNALEQLGFPENDDRVIEHEGKLAFITCSHDPDCDDMFALIAELAARGESWELQFRVDTGEGRAIFQRLARHQRVEAVDSAVPIETDEAAAELPTHDLDSDTGRAELERALDRIDPAEVFVTVGSHPTGRATAVVVRRSPRRALFVASGTDEASLRAAIREKLPTVMFAVTMKPTDGA
ncbi:MAG: hypothetical protein KGL11_06320 [Alphaproteobacteria bacterium]|nr:hypothetical protein [Alphaproteobacteria bacterium]